MSSFGDKSIYWPKYDCSASRQGVFYSLCLNVGGPGSLVGIATAYGLDGTGIESQWGEIFRTSPDRP